MPVGSGALLGAASIRDKQFGAQSPGFVNAYARSMVPTAGTAIRQQQWQQATPAPAPAGQPPFPMIDEPIAQRMLSDQSAPVDAATRRNAPGAGQMVDNTELRRLLQRLLEMI